jgi:O-antigen/teichoic acid export membrane protein
MIKFIKSAGFTFFTQLIILFFSLASNILIARILGADGKGTITLITNFFLILVTIAILGMNEGNIYYLRGKNFKHGEVYFSIILHSLITSLFIVAIALIFKQWLITHFLKNIKTSYYLIGLAIFPIHFLHLHISTMLLGHKNITGFNVISGIRYLLIFLFQLLLIPKYGITGCLTGIIIGISTADIIGMFFLSRYGAPSLKPNMEFYKKSFIFGLKSQTGLLLSFFDRRLDVFFINLFLNPTQVGIYSIAVAIAELPWYIPNALATVLFPEVSGMQKKEAYLFIARVCRNTLMVICLVLIILFFLGGFIIRFLFGPQFSQSLIPLHYLLPGIIFLSINKILCSGFSGIGHPEYGTYTTFLSAIATIILDLILIPKIGIKGASIASSVAYTISAITGIIIFHRISGVSYRQFLLVNTNDLTAYPAMWTKLTRRIRNA